MYTLTFAVAVAAICTPLAAAQDAAYTAALGALSPATHTGKVTIYTSGSSGATDTLSLVIEVSSTLACTSNNCGAHVHAGTACTDSSTQGAHMLNVDGVTDAWTGKMQFVDTVGTMSTYTVEVPAGNAVITGKPFVVHDATSARVMCGMMGAAPSTTRKYAAVLADIGASGVGAGSVSLYAVGPSSMLLQVELPSSLSCQGNTCGAHVHAGTGCADASAQGGHMLSVDGTDAWTAKMAFVKTMGALSTYYIDVPSGNTAVLDKPFVVHNSAGVRVSCGLLRPRQYSGAAYAPQYNNAYVASLDALASYTGTGSVSIYTRGATMLSVVIKVSSTLACTSNNCGAHVHAGSACTDATTQGGHMLNSEGADAWTGKMQFVDTVGTKSTYTIDVATGGNANVIGKPFVVHDASSARVMCGMLGAAPSTTRKYAAVLTDIGASGVVVGVGSISLYAVGPSTISLQVDLPSSLSCQTNTCGAHVHAGTGCADSSAQGGHMLNVDGTTDAWTAKMTFVKTVGSVSTYYITFANGNTAVLDKPFVVHNSDGVRVSCGVLRSRQYSGALYSLPTAQVKAVPAGVDTDTSAELAVAIVVSVVSTITIAGIVVVLALVVSIILLKKGAKRIEHDLQEGPSAEMLSLAENPPHNFSNLPGNSATGEQPSPKLIAKVVVAIDGEADALVSSASAIVLPRASDSEAPLGDEEKAALQATMKKHRDRVGHATRMLAKHKDHIDSNSVLAKLRAGSIRGVKASPIGKRRASITMETANPMAMMRQASGRIAK